MRTFTAICLLALCAVALAKPGAQYTDKYDNINVDEILSNERLLVPYIRCCLDRGRCSPEGKELKSHIKEALENDCAKCTEKQRTQTRKVIGHLINHQATWWNDLTAKYDPGHKFATKYEDELRTIKA